MAEVDLNDLARGLGEEPEGSTNVLGNFFRFISRPYYAVGSILTGRPGDALANMGQFALDLPTGGFLNRDFSLANLLDSDGDITDRSQRPEGTDILRRWGVGAPRSSLGKLTADIALGVALDPLTYLTLGSGTLAKGSLAALKPVAGLRAAKALKETKLGSAAFESAYRSLPSSMSGIERTTAAAERVFADAIGSPDFRFLTTVDETGSRLMNQGIQAARDQNLVRDSSAAYFMGAKVPGSQDVFGKIGRYATLPGWARIGAMQIEATRPMVQAVDEGTQAAWDWTKRKLYSRYLTPAGVPAGMEDVVRQTNIDREAYMQRVRLSLPKFFGEFTTEERESLAKAWAGAQDDYLLLQTNPANAREEIARLEKKIRRRERRGLDVSPQDIDRRDQLVSDLAKRDQLVLEYARQTPRITRTTSRTIPGAVTYSAAEEEALDLALRQKALGVEPREPVAQGRAVSPELVVEESIELRPPGSVLDRDDFVSRLFSKAVETAESSVRPEVAGKVRPALDYYSSLMQEIPKELTRVGVWKEGDANPFYLPFQLADDFAEMLPDMASDQKFRAAVKSVFDKRRKYPTQREFFAAIAEVAKKHGHDFGGVEDLADLDIAQLAYRRAEAFATTRARGETLKIAREGFGLKPGDAVDRYIGSVFENVNVRPNVLGKILGGGTIRYRLPDGTEKKLKTKGLNHYFKGKLTVLWPAFHGRNTASAFVMTLFDPDMSVQGAAEALASTPSAGLEAGKAILLAQRGGMQAARLQPGQTKKELSTFMAALAGDEVAIKAAAELPIRNESGDVMFTGLEVLEQLRGAVYQSGGGGSADLLSEINVLQDLGESVREPGFFERWEKVGGQLSDYIENSFRIQGYLGLVKKGVPPAEASKRVARAYVSYERNSVTETFLRDLFPFIRFAIGIVPPAAESAVRRPRTVNFLARAQGSLQEEDQQFLPERVAAGPAVPWGDGAFVTGFGLPQEAAAQSIGALTSFEGFRRGALGALQPLIRTPLEAATGKSFYFGEEFGKYRRAPSYLPDFLTSEVETAGGKRREVPSWVHDWVIGISPFSRFESELDRWGRDDLDLTQKALQSFTGLRLTQADQLTEAREAIVRVLKEAAGRGQVGTVDAFFARGEKEALPDAVRLALEELPAVKEAIKKKREERDSWLPR